MHFLTLRRLPPFRKVRRVEYLLKPIWTCLASADGEEVFTNDLSLRDASSILLLSIGLLELSSLPLFLNFLNTPEKDQWQFCSKDCWWSPGLSPGFWEGRWGLSSLRIICYTFSLSQCVIQSFKIFTECICWIKVWAVLRKKYNFTSPSGPVFLFRPFCDNKATVCDIS